MTSPIDGFGPNPRAWWENIDPDARAATVQRLRGLGHSFVAIGATFRISRQRAYQFMPGPRAALKERNRVRMKRLYRSRRRPPPVDPAAWLKSHDLGGT